MPVTSFAWKSPRSSEIAAAEHDVEILERNRGSVREVQRPERFERRVETPVVADPREIRVAVERRLGFAGDAFVGHGQNLPRLGFTRRRPAG